MSVNKVEVNKPRKTTKKLEIDLPVTATNALPVKKSDKQIEQNKEISNFRLFDSLESKKEIIFKTYPELMTELHFYRQLISRITLGYLGVTLLLLGWVFGTNKPRSENEIVVVILIIIISVFGLLIMHRLKKYFNQTAKVVNTLENLMGLNEKNVFLSEDQIFPDEWKDFGSDKWKEPMIVFGNWIFVFGIIISIMSLVIFSFLQGNMLFGGELIKQDY